MTPSGLRAPRSVSGFTLIELLVTMALVGIIATLVVPSFRTMAANQVLSGAASDLMSSALQARSAALKFNRRVLVQPQSGSDWRTGWIVYVDVDKNATYDSSTDTLLATSPPLSSDIAIGSLTGTAENQSISVIGYDPDGFLATVGTSGNGSILMSSSFTQRQKYVIVSRVGRVRLCDPKVNPSTGSCPPSG